MMMIVVVVVVVVVVVEVVVVVVVIVSLRGKESSGWHLFSSTNGRRGGSFNFPFK